MNPLLITLVGPTAIGKTAFSIELANAFDTEIISADSRQFFKEMSIGTAKPTPPELAAANHHFVDFLSIHDSFSAGDFERAVLVKLDELFKSNDVIIMSGGSGLYVNAVLNGFDPLPYSKEIREQLNAKVEKEGISPLVEQLETLDPVFAASVDKANTQRVIRALEVCLVAKKPYSSLRSKTNKKRSFSMLNFGLDAPRPWIYERINKRVDMMIEEGLLQEVESLAKHQGLNSLKSVGYTELFDYLNQKCTLQEAVEQIKLNTRRFSKRQLTWFRNKLEVQWLDAQVIQQNPEIGIEKVKEYIQAAGILKQ